MKEKRKLLTFTINGVTTELEYRKQPIMAERNKFFDTIEALERLQIGYQISFDTKLDQE